MAKTESTQVEVIAIEKDITTAVQKRIEKLQEAGQIHFPKNYSAANALRQAWLTIQETKDKSNKPALDVCTTNSIYNALFNTVIQGLSPAKNQIYYVVYGDKLQATRSYFGTLAVTKRLEEIKEIFADVVYKDDTFKTSKKRGTWVIEEHSSSFENINPENIVAAYCTIITQDDREYTEIMNFKQIQTSWNKSKTTQGVHKDFPDQMAKRTVINRACKIFINSSDDSDLVIESFAQTGEHYEDAPPETTKEVKKDDRLAAINAQLTADIYPKVKQEDKATIIEVTPEEIIDSETTPPPEKSNKVEEVTADENGQIRID